MLTVVAPALGEGPCPRQTDTPPCPWTLSTFATSIHVRPFPLTVTDRASSRWATVRSTTYPGAGAQTGRAISEPPDALAATGEATGAIAAAAGAQAIQSAAAAAAATRIEGLVRSAAEATLPSLPPDAGGPQISR
jgi:hypothetical protein